MEGRNADFYQRLRERIQSWLEGKGKQYKYADYLLFAPDLFHLLCKLTIDKRVPATERALLGGAVAYFISPVDLLPEAIVGPGGYIDDVALAAFVLHRVINAGHGELAKEHWAGEDDLLTVIQRILGVADAALGSGLWKRLKGLGGGGSPFV